MAENLIHKLLPHWNCGEVILNWECSVRELRVHDPATGDRPRSFTGDRGRRGALRNARRVFRDRIGTVGWAVLWQHHLHT